MILRFVVNPSHFKLATKNKQKSKQKEKKERKKKERTKERKKETQKHRNKTKIKQASKQINYKSTKNGNIDSCVFRKMSWLAQLLCRAKYSVAAHQLYIDVDLTVHPIVPRQGDRCTPPC